MPTGRKSSLNNSTMRTAKKLGNESQQQHHRRQQGNREHESKNVSQGS